ncbi:MAG: hypothetical protein EOQ86_20835 [Mesorhizobium sp.]|uniref:hypothetical protein n=1 Tax=Mesorhizobium sp. TaxID=1871066 RepID=UPI000FE9D206|nr:hypothetical protein [Mesorhizobium sp.]RWH76501.1 MAG: hypothetical protein EOQ85_21315 [Mesorhizobium sp.]RWH79985.1 MAG: hypothetical protein EOQ86_20835 [Mesorhizobium sp.]RWH89141.1 MAG: hypothetical protein EOQ87_17770 [Mesorhizobium sp.]RWI01845.1 MAG: hypothetical protein EOQ88_05495 [Mesorhizobium sp.]RWI03393.1 MAG: hypothetical protein EOQ89_12305 [Mesorhizobium sp.]
MDDRINTLDELLSDPMVKLVMERDRVQPAELRSLLEEKVRRDDAPVNPVTDRPNSDRLGTDSSVPPAHMVTESCHNLWLCG